LPNKIKTCYSTFYPFEGSKHSRGRFRRAKHNGEWAWARRSSWRYGGLRVACPSEVHLSSIIVVAGHSTTVGIGNACRSMGASLLMAPMFVVWINGLEGGYSSSNQPLGPINFTDLDLEPTTQKQFRIYSPSQFSIKFDLISCYKYLSSY
jgi:hypothetical protein